MRVSYIIEDEDIQHELWLEKDLLINDTYSVIVASIFDCMGLSFLKVIYDTYKLILNENFRFQITPIHQSTYV